MSYHQFAAYEGPEDYIFVSYSHKDTEKVVPIMEKLRELGCRIWYDEGITPGSEWPEDIARHLNGCAMAIAFISPNSMASVNCRREINFALSKQKPFLSVVLEPTEMPLGMELQLSAQQSVLRYNYRTEEQFIDKICACPDLARCKESLKQPEPAPLVEPVPEKIREPEVAVVPEEPVADPKSETTKTKSSKGNGKLLGIIAVVAVAIAALLTLLLATTKNGGQESSAGNTEAPAVQAQSAETEGEEIVVHVKLPKDWTSAGLWAWSEPSGREAFDAWPGLPLEMGKDGWYTATVPAWVNRVIISGNNGQCESEHVSVSEKDIWIVVREDWTCQYSYDGPFVATIRIYAEFDTWTDPYCWAWTGTGDVFEAWPGESFEKSGDWYTIDLPVDVVGFKLSDQATGLETKDNLVEPGWDIWFYERYGYCVWDYIEIPENELKEIFSQVAPQ